MDRKTYIPGVTVMKTFQAILENEILFLFQSLFLNLDAFFSEFIKFFHIYNMANKLENRDGGIFIPYQISFLEMLTS